MPLQTAERALLTNAGADPRRSARRRAPAARRASFAHRPRAQGAAGVVRSRSRAREPHQREVGCVPGRLRVLLAVGPLPDRRRRVSVPRRSTRSSPRRTRPARPARRSSASSSRSAGPKSDCSAKVIDAVDAVQRETGLEVACSLGLLDDEQAARLAAAGVRRYNHNLEACREVFPADLHDAQLRRPRRDARRSRANAGMELCCGGILGMGETLDQRVDFAFELAELEPCEVPINLLDPRPGTPLDDHATLSPARSAAGDRPVPVDPSRRVAAPRGRPRARARRAAGHGAAGRRQRADRRQLPHDDRPGARRGPRAARRARHAGRRRPGRRSLHRRRDRRPRPPGAPVDPASRVGLDLRGARRR